MILRDRCTVVVCTRAFFCQANKAVATAQLARAGQHQQKAILATLEPDVLAVAIEHGLNMLSNLFPRGQRWRLGCGHDPSMLSEFKHPIRCFSFSTLSDPRLGHSVSRPLPTGLKEEPQLGSMLTRRCPVSLQTSPIPPLLNPLGHSSRDAL